MTFTSSYQLRRAVNRHYERYAAEKAMRDGAIFPTRNVNSLLPRLQAAHPCRRTTGPRFVQLPAHNGAREWCCQGCGAIVHLDAKGGA